MSSELKKCPFCGAEAKSDGDTTAERVGCSSPSCFFSHYLFRRKDWNRRAEVECEKRNKEE